MLVPYTLTHQPIILIHSDRMCRFEIPSQSVVQERGGSPHYWMWIPWSLLDPPVRWTDLEGFSWKLYWKRYYNRYIPTLQLYSICAAYCEIPNIVTSDMWQSMRVWYVFVNIFSICYLQKSLLLQLRFRSRLGGTLMSLVGKFLDLNRDCCDVEP